MRSHRIRFKLPLLMRGSTLVATLMTSCAYAQTGTASNIQATMASLALPAQIAYDASGNLFIADPKNNIVREVNLAGIISTVAGTGEQGFSGDGGPATDALLDSPSGIAVDAAGSIYIADTHNQRIRKVSGGTITTIAGTGVPGFSGDGGSAVLAALNNPTALALDSSGSLYIADIDNHRIRKINGTTITTVAGSGEQFFSGDGGAATAAGLDSPSGVAVDATGNLYIADTRNQRVRVVSPSGTISTLAGNDSKAYAGDGGPATASSLARPRGLSLDAQGNIYVADSDNHRIRLIGKTGNISTVAGNGSQGFSGDGGQAVNANLDTPWSPSVQARGSFALSDSHNHLVREVSPDGTIHTIAGVTSGIGSGTGVPGETLTLSGSSTIAYGTGSLTAIFTNGSQIATGQVSLLDTAIGSTPLLLAALSTNVATFDTSTLAAGTHHLVVSYAGDANNPAITSAVFVLTVTPLPVTANAAGLSLQYGEAIPVITGTLTGVLPQDGNNVSAVFTTTATQTSPVGQYPISVALTGSAAGNYAVTLASTSGDVAIGKAASTITLAASNTAPYVGAPVTFTAQVASTTTGIPTGNVILYDGNALLTTVPVSTTGSAAYTLSGVALGSHTITAVYSGDSNFQASTAAATVATVSTVPDFILSPTGTPTQSVNPGQTATYNFTLQPLNGSFSSAITLSASGLPPGEIAVFTPATITPGGTATLFALAIKPAGLAAWHTPQLLPVGTPMLPLSAALFLLPFLPKRSRASANKMPRMLLSALFILIGGVATLGLTGCGSGYFTQAQRTYTITVTGTAVNAVNTTLQRTTTVTLIVQ